VEVAHDILISAHQEKPEVIGFLPVSILIERMEGQGIADVPQIDELVDLAIGITGDIDEGGLADRVLVQPVHGHNGEELAESPMIQQGLEDGKVAEVLVTETVFEFADFFGDVGLPDKALHHFAAYFPIKMLDLRFIAEIEEPEGEHIVGVFLAFERVVKSFQLV
jgi:hypothetical protein